MEPFLYLFFGFVLGVEAGRQMTQKPFSLKRALLTGLVAFLVAIAIVVFID